MGSQRIYFDHNATTPVYDQVVEAMLPYFTERFGNPASRTHAFGWEADEAVKMAREQVAEIIGASPGEIVFTSGSTEALNLAIKGLWDVYSGTAGKHILVGATEHKAVLDCVFRLREKGATVDVIPVDREGRMEASAIEALLRKDTLMVCAMMANNETGVIQPVEEIGDLLARKNVFFVCDTTQAVGKIAVDVKENRFSVACLSAHKFGGPKGAGALYLSRRDPRINLTPLFDGGGHEGGLRSGTLNVPGIVGMARALEISSGNMWEESARLSKMRAYLEQPLLDLGDLYINGSTRYRLYNTTNLLLKGVKAEKLISRMPLVAMATGSACTSAEKAPSHVLTAMGLTQEEGYSSVRFSLGWNNTMEEVAAVVEQLRVLIPDLRKS